MTRLSRLGQTSLWSFFSDTYLVILIPYQSLRYQLQELQSQNINLSSTRHQAHPPIRAQRKHAALELQKNHQGQAPSSSWKLISWRLEEILCSAMTLCSALPKSCPQTTPWYEQPSNKGQVRLFFFFFSFPLKLKQMERSSKALLRQAAKAARWSFTLANTDHFPRDVISPAALTRATVSPTPLQKQLWNQKPCLQGWALDMHAWAPDVHTCIRTTLKLLTVQRGCVVTATIKHASMPSCSVICLQRPKVQTGFLCAYLALH